MNKILYALAIIIATYCCIPLFGADENLRELLINNLQAIPTIQSKLRYLDQLIYSPLSQLSPEEKAIALKLKEELIKHLIRKNV